MNFHTPVLLKEVLHYLDPKPGQVIVDGTLGGGGHAAEIAKHIVPDGTLIGIDLDEKALDEARSRFAVLLAVKAVFVHGNYAEVDGILDRLGFKYADAILVDLGISSYDLDFSQRGFSFQKDEPLDMRFNAGEELQSNLESQSKQKQPFTAKYVLNNYSEKQLAEIFRKYGQERFAKKIARAIVNVRQTGNMESTKDLFDLIKKALPGQIRHKAADVARRIFQAFRIEVNHELDNLEKFLPKAFARLKLGGRLAVISFHSLEDRIVKSFFKEKSKGCVCPVDFPECRCGKEPLAKILTPKPVMAGQTEQKINSRSKPAKLRVIQKIADDQKIND